MGPEILGYTSSLILLVTIVAQLVRQWQSGNSKGVSGWLFIGQLGASVGFTIYSAILKDAVFTLSSACLSIAALVGIGIALYHRWKNRSAPVSLASSDLPRKYAI